MCTCVGVWYCVQARERAAQRWKDKDKTTRQLLLCAISAMLKVECCSSAIHTMDEMDPVGFCMYKSLTGVDCTFPGSVLHPVINIFILYKPN